MNGVYQVSNKGRIRSLPRYVKDRNRDRLQLIQGKIIKGTNSGHGYLKVCLCKNGKRKSCFVHRLVAETFIDNSNNYREVNHKDLDKSNNCLENLEWVSSSINKEHFVATDKGRECRKIGGETRFLNLVKDKEDVIIELYKNGETIRNISNKMKLNHSTISKILKRNKIPIKLRNTKGQPFNDYVICQFNESGKLLKIYNNWLDIYNFIIENKLSEASYDTITSGVYDAITMRRNSDKKYGFIWKKGRCE